MKHSEDIDNVYNEEEYHRCIPNDGLKETQIEPVDWDDI